MYLRERLEIGAANLGLKLHTSQQYNWSHSMHGLGMRPFGLRMRLFRLGMRLFGLGMRQVLLSLLPCRVMECCGLSAWGCSGFSDPYCQVTLLGLQGLKYTYLCVIHLSSSVMWHAIV